MPLRSVAVVMAPSVSWRKWPTLPASTAGSSRLPGVWVCVLSNAPSVSEPQAPKTITSTATIATKRTGAGIFCIICQCLIASLPRCLGYRPRILPDTARPERRAKHRPGQACQPARPHAGTRQFDARLARWQRRAVRHVRRVDRQEVANAGVERVPHVVLLEDRSGIATGVIGATRLIDLLQRAVSVHLRDGLVDLWQQRRGVRAVRVERDAVVARVQVAADGLVFAAGVACAVPLGDGRIQEL